jgi:hypothetical protein
MLRSVFCLLRVFFLLGGRPGTHGDSALQASLVIFCCPFFVQAQRVPRQITQVGLAHCPAIHGEHAGCKHDEIPVVCFIVSVWFLVELVLASVFCLIQA